MQELDWDADCAHACNVALNGVSTIPDQNLTEFAQSRQQRTGFTWEFTAKPRLQGRLY
jgi:hypothetical protein